MNEGYWINYERDITIPIDEHERFIRDPKNAKKIGLSPSVIKSFSKFKPVQDRDRFLLFLMQQAPIMRVRGHGSSITFEFSTHSRQTAMDSIWVFGKENAGPFTMLNIVNFATGEKVEMLFQDFEELMDSGGAEGVLRAASIHRISVKPKIASALVKLAKELIA
jgi:hypothetical protein